MASGEAPRGAGVSFALPRGAPKPRASVAVNGGSSAGPARDLVTAVDGGSLASAAPRAGPAAPLVIPALPNTFETGVGKRPRGVPSFLPERSTDVADGERFEKAVENETAQAAGVAYGLNKRQRPEKASDAAAAPADADAEPDAAAPRERSFVERALEEREREREHSHARHNARQNAPADDAAQFRDDLQRLPDSAPLEAYEAMPIEAFGEAMLRGMGWREGGPVGRNSSAVVKPVEYIPRPERLGLGANAPAAPPAHGPADGRPLRPGESREGRQHMALPVGPDGRVRNVRTLDEALVVREAAGARAGKRMVVAEGPHAGLACEVVSVQPAAEGRSERATVRLERGGAVLTLRSRHLADMGSREAEKAQAAAAAAAAPPPSSSQQQQQQQQREPEREAPPWLAPHIRVRVVSRRLGDGAHYLQKGTVVDVLTPGVCMLKLDSGALLDAVPQRALETVLPKRAGRVAVVSGRHRGARAKMLSRDADAGTAHVQLCADFAMHTLPLDVIAEYVGPQDELD